MPEGKEEVTEREEFEAWAKEYAYDDDQDMSRLEAGDNELLVDPDNTDVGDYTDVMIEEMWQAWQARGLSVEEGCTETDAKMLRTTNQKLIAENEHLKDLLSEAATDLEDWGGYASEYLQEKHNLKADVLKYREAGE